MGDGVQVTNIKLIRSCILFLKKKKKKIKRKKTKKHHQQHLELHL